jgi:hypothetical protein
VLVLQCPVILNIYDLLEENQYAHTFGLGAYHTGVEIMGTGMLLMSHSHYSRQRISMIALTPPSMHRFIGWLMHGSMCWE